MDDPLFNFITDLVAMFTKQALLISSVRRVRLGRIFARARLPLSRKAMRSVANVYLPRCLGAWSRACVAGKQVKRPSAREENGYGFQ